MKRFIVKIRIYICMTVFLLFFSQSPAYAQTTVTSSHPELSRYLDLNNLETRLSDYADNELMLNLKLYQLDVINESRRKAGRNPVELDILACRVANMTAWEACLGGYSGHWNLRGEKPYHRYAFAGGVDHVSENASSRWSSAPLVDNPASYTRFMEDSHRGFINEVPPNDGHRKNCLDPVHTHVGIGAALSGNDFRYYEEYIDRYLEFGDLSETSAGEEFTVALRPRNESQYLYAVAAYYEAYPKSMTAAEINRKGSYPDYTSSQVLTLWPWDLSGMTDPDTRWTRVPVTFQRPGLYYLHVYLTASPPPKSGSASTRGKIQGSGLVVRVR